MIQPQRGSHSPHKPVRARIKHNKKKVSKLTPENRDRARRTYSSSRYRWYQIKGWFQNFVEQRLTERKINVIAAGFTGLLSARFGYMNYNSMVPFLSSIAGDPGRIMLVGGISYVCCLVSYKSVIQLLSTIKECCTMGSIHHARAMFKGSSVFGEICKTKAEDIISAFCRQLYINERVDEAVKDLDVGSFQEQIMDYLDYVFFHNQKFSSLDVDRQISSVKKIIKKDLKKYIKDQKCYTPAGYLFRELVEATTNILKPDNDMTFISLVEDAISELCENDEEARNLFERMELELPGVYESGFMNAILIDIILLQVNKISPKKWIELCKAANPYLVDVLEGAIISHLNDKVEQVKTKEQEVCKKEVARKKDENEQLSEEESVKHLEVTKKSVKVKSKRIKSFESKGIGKEKRVQSNKIELDKATKEKIINATNTSEENRFIKKCLERIENCLIWNGIRSAVSYVDKWCGHDMETGKNTLVYHMSSGINKGYNSGTATLIFTRNGDKVEPIAIAKHTGKKSSEYKINHLLGGWMIEPSIVDLNTNLHAYKHASTESHDKSSISR